jgi:rare lipoprotein A
MMRNIGFSLGLMLASSIFVGCISAPRFTSSKSERDFDYESISMVEEGMASYYADEFQGRQTSNGETFDMNQFTAAHQTLPFNSKVRVTNLTNGKSVVVRINDRGPFKDDRIIDLSLAAAKEIELISTGTGRVRLEVIKLGSSDNSQKP